MVKTSFIRYFIVTAENLIWPVVFDFSVHGDRQRNIYLQALVDVRLITPAEARF